MGEEYQGNWMLCLPWVLFSRRTAYHGELKATPAQAVFGEDPKLPGDLSPPLGSSETIQDIIARVKANAQRPPAQTDPHKKIPVYMPAKAHTTTHVYTKRAKKEPLGPRNDRPFRINRRIGKSCLELEVGHYNNGQPRLETRHWRTCFLADVAEGQAPGESQRWAESPETRSEVRIPDSVLLYGRTAPPQL